LAESVKVARRRSARIRRVDIARQKSDPWDFLWLLRLGRVAKRKEQGTKSKESDFFLHVF
jgi:hypothetical protein